MRSIVYCGVDFGSWCSAEAFEPCGHAVSPRAVAVPGRPGAALLGGEVGPRVLRVRLYWDFLRDVDEAGRADVRHAVYAALLRPGGGVLRLPGDPGVAYRDAVCTGCGSWSSLFADGVAEVEFTCFDPVGFGALRSSGDCRFVVGGSWATWPVVEMVAEAGDSVGVSSAADSPCGVVVERAFVGGEKVSIDFEREACLVDGVDCSSCVSLGSGFFLLSPGVCELEFAGCSAHSVSWFERWL